MTTADRPADIELLTKLDEHDLRPEERDAFTDMRVWLQDNPRASLSTKQREWAQRVLERFAPRYENLVSSGQVPRGREVPLVPMLRPENLPMKPPGRTR